MLYVLDSNSFIVLSHYFPNRFPTFWSNLNAHVRDGHVISVREVKKELSRGGDRSHLEKWINDNRAIFLTPSKGEMDFVAQIFAVPRFLELVRSKQILKGMPVADPFVIAAAKARGGCVVTEETEKPNSARIPNVCSHFGVDCTSLEGFMEREGWSF